jgi:RHH-type transcriptional regulator, rel operon repressor / antitoxin RelB
MTFSVRLPDDLDTRLDHLSEITGRSKAYYVKEALLEYLDDIEDIYLAEREIEAVRAGLSITTPLAEVMKLYGMAG